MNHERRARTIITLQNISGFSELIEDIRRRVMP